MNTLVDPSISFDADRRDVWRLAPGSHLAIAPERRGLAVRAHVTAGELATDPITGVGSLTVAFTAASGVGQIRCRATRGERDAHGLAVWSVRGSLELGGRATPITMMLRDHGVTHWRCTWWWLSGTGEEQTCTRRPHTGSRVVADLLFTPTRG